MGSQSRIVHALDLSMLREEARHLGPILGVRTHSPWQRAHPAQNQPAIERRGDRPAGILNRANPLEEIALLSCDDDSAKHIAMTAEVFGRRMQDQIGAELERPLQNRSEEHTSELQ